MLTCLSLFYFYLRIFSETIKARQSVRRREQSQARHHRLDLSFSIGLFSSLTLFSLSFVPFCILLIVDYEDKLSRIFHLYGLLFVRINSCLNPVLYRVTNSKFKQGFNNFFNLLFNRNEYEYSLDIKQKKLQLAKDMEEIQLKNSIKKLQKRNDQEKIDLLKKNFNDIIVLEGNVEENLTPEDAEENTLGHDGLNENFSNKKKNLKIPKSLTFAFESTRRIDII